MHPEGVLTSEQKEAPKNQLLPSYPPSKQAKRENRNLHRPTGNLRQSDKVDFCFIRKIILKKLKLFQFVWINMLKVEI